MAFLSLQNSFKMVQIHFLVNLESVLIYFISISFITLFFCCLFYQINIISMKFSLPSSDYNQHQAPDKTANPSFLKPFVNPYINVRSDEAQCN